jgi:hypothetical protein
MQGQYTNNQAISRDMMNKFMGAIEQWEFIKKAEIEKQSQYTEEQKKISVEIVKNFDLKLKELTDEYNKHRLTFEQSRDAINQHIGALEENKYLMMLMKQ